MLTNLKIRNFKAWSQMEAKLAPLTVFFGSNSSGKSSINQLLLMLKQTVQSSDRKMVLNFGDKTTAIELGSFWNVIYSHQEDKRIAFELEWQVPKEKPIFKANKIKFCSEIGLNHRQEIVVHQMSYEVDDPSQTGFKAQMKRNNDSYSLTTLPDDLLPAQELDNPLHFYGFPSEITTNVDFLYDLTLALEKRLQDIYYLGALREQPQRYYIRSGEIPESVGWRGERAVDAILAAHNKFIIQDDKQLPFEAIIADWLKKMGLIEAFEIKQVAAHRRDYEVLVQTIGLKEKVNLSDVGFGISQVLPVLVQCFYANQGSTIIIEQPEVHLHPSAQAVLADLFIEAQKQTNIQLIIESHSEHFLRRLQRRIAEQKISSSDTAIYFCDMNESGSILKPLDIDDYGNIKNWPENFFGDEIGDLTAMTEAAIKRKTKL
jgi:predicted ATPase